MSYFPRYASPFLNYDFILLDTQHVSMHNTLTGMLTLFLSAGAGPTKLENILREGYSPDGMSTQALLPSCVTISPVGHCEKHDDDVWKSCDPVACSRSARNSQHFYLAMLIAFINSWFIFRFSDRLTSTLPILEEPVGAPILIWRPSKWIGTMFKMWKKGNEP
jgi:hypothetical protein